MTVRNETASLSIEDFKIHSQEGNIIRLVRNELEACVRETETACNDVMKGLKELFPVPNLNINQDEFWSGRSPRKKNEQSRESIEHELELDEQQQNGFAALDNDILDLENKLHEKKDETKVHLSQRKNNMNKKKGRPTDGWTKQKKALASEVNVIAQELGEMKSKLNTLQKIHSLGKEIS